MKVLDKDKLLERMTERKNVLYDHITRDFGSEYVPTRVYEHSEVKYWKEFIERGEVDVEEDSEDVVSEISHDFQVYIVMTLTNEPVDFTFYTDEEVVKKRVNELNGLSDLGTYWYISLSGNFRNAGELVRE